MAVVPSIRYLGHASLLACGGGVRVAFDPLAPVEADAVCITHAHLDHFRVEALREMPRSARVVVPRIARPGRAASAMFRLHTFRPGADAEARYGDLLEEAAAELEALAATPRGRAAADEIARVRALRDAWRKLNTAMRAQLLSSFREEGVVAPQPEKRLGVRRAYNPDLGAACRALGFRDVVELAPWEDCRAGGATVTRVPARIAHGVTEQAQYLFESPEFTLFEAGDALEDGPTHSYAGRTFEIDIAFLPVAGRTYWDGTPWAYRDTMDVDGAVDVTRWLDAKEVVPFQEEGAPDRRAEFAARVPRARLMAPGETWLPPGCR